MRSRNQQSTIRFDDSYDPSSQPPVHPPVLVVESVPAREDDLRVTVSGARRDASPWRALLHALQQKVLHYPTTHPASFRRRHFRQTGLVGRGSFGEVHVARAPAATGLPRRVALKTTYPPWRRKKPVSRAQLEREVCAHALVSAHPHVVTLYGSGVRGRSSWLAMQLLHGSATRALHEVAARLGRAGLGERVGVRVALQVADALSHMHARGVVHRDVKPHNIMLSACVVEAVRAAGRKRASVACAADSPRGGDKRCRSRLQPAPAPDMSGVHACVCDFGLAETFDPRRPQTALSHSRAGTESHCGPEICGDGGFDLCKGDVYALGVTLYRLVCGEVPFQTPGKKKCDMGLRAELKRCGPQFVEKEWGDVRKDTRDVVRALLEPDARKRPAMHQAFALLHELDIQLTD